jgi:hemolysin activation/secretion protein
LPPARSRPCWRRSAASSAISATCSALEALEAAYRERGYNVVTVELPEQELNGGVVQLRVVETKIGRVSVKNNQYFDEANIRRSLPALQEGSRPT